jgi:hypothetical protein
MAAIAFVVAFTSAVYTSLLVSGRISPWTLLFIPALVGMWVLADIAGRPRPSKPITYRAPDGLCQTCHRNYRHHHHWT